MEVSLRRWGNPRARPWEIFTSWIRLRLRIKGLAFYIEKELFSSLPYVADEGSISSLSLADDGNYIQVPQLPDLKCDSLALNFLISRQLFYWPVASCSPRLRLASIEKPNDPVFSDVAINHLRCRDRPWAILLANPRRSRLSWPLVKAKPNSFLCFVR